jgi:hypothetical protein
MNSVEIGLQMDKGASRYGARDILAVPELTRDGSRVSLEFTIAFLTDDDGKVAGVAAVLRDVTERFEEVLALSASSCITARLPARTLIGNTGVTRRQRCPCPEGSWIDPGNLWGWLASNPRNAGRSAAGGRV